MSSPPSVRAAIVVSLSIIAVDVANAKGTFRLQGPWPSPKVVTAGVAIPTPSISVPSFSARDLVGGCGRGRARDPQTHSCRGPADIR